MKKIIIGGCPRSGTGALAKLLTFDGRAIVTEELGLNAWKDAIKKRNNTDDIVYVGDKMPESYICNASRLYKQYPNAKFIFTNRNGYGVVSSYVRRLLRGTNYKDVPDEKLIKMIKFGEVVWLRNYRGLNNIHNILPSNKYILMTYEETTCTLSKSLSKLGEFLEYDGPVKNERVVLDKGTRKNVIYYRPIHTDWVKGLEFWDDAILSQVSDEFKQLVDVYMGNVDEFLNA